MTTKHTPGPWAAHESEDDPFGDIEVRARGRKIARLWLDDAAHDFNPGQRANARLIAAAPELLGALKECRDACLFAEDDGIGVSEDVVIPSDLFGRICAAIVKAEGRAND